AVGIRSEGGGRDEEDARGPERDEGRARAYHPHGAGGGRVVARSARHRHLAASPFAGEFGTERARDLDPLDEAWHLRAVHAARLERSSDQSRAATSSQRVPEASDMSET